MTRQELLQRSSTLLGRFAHEVKVANAMGQFDINSIAEDFLVPILSNVFKCPDLRNQNRIQMNFPAVDLGCNSSRTSVQITSDPSSGKIIETLEKFDAHDLKSDFDKLYVYVITERQDVYSSQKLKQTADKSSMPFDAASDIFDYRDLARMLETLSTDKLQIINDHLESEFKKADNELQFRSNLEEFTGVSRQKIEDEKRTKKYIPSVFVETTTTKEEMRYFANPMFFFRKIDDDLRRISLDRFNGILEMAKIEPITKNIQDLQCLGEPKDLIALQDRFEQQHRALEAIQELVSPYSWYGEKAERYEPTDYLSGYWEVFRHSIQLSGSGIFTGLERIADKISIARAKIFLVTGMAGQGKTNFVCDLVENQFRSFEVPTIFIPARSLNDYSSPSRIFSYIKNNRFAPDVTDLHDLLALLNNVAAECQKPFVLVIDGINEIGDLDGFVGELRVLLEALCQYDFLKIVVTCRSEFFDHKFAEVFEPQFSDQLYRVQDLRKKMSDDNKVRLLSAYLEHFKIDARLSKTSSTFLENDLILLRIFCEINENKNIGRVPDIYKGDIFEDYLLMKINEFPVSARRNVLTSLYKICSKMLSDENFTQLSLESFDLPERQIVDRLIGEDIILRREVPTSGLSSVGVENISFTYDELRDFLLAYYTVIELAASQSDQLTEIFRKLPQWPIYEGFFRYVYILARKQESTQVLAACEESQDFEKHYLNNLTLLSADIQTPEDVERLKLFLEGATTDRKIRQVAWFLFRKRESSEQLNVQILLDHMNGLDDKGSERLVRSMFSRSSDYRVNTWRDRVSGLIKNFLKIDDEHRHGVGVPATALVLHFAPHAHWDEREAIFNHFGEPKNALAFRAVNEVCRRAVSQKVKICLQEISEPRESA